LKQDDERYNALNHIAAVTIISASENRFMPLIHRRRSAAYAMFVDTVVAGFASVMTLFVSQVPASEMLFIFLRPGL
jgi:hypothetical protein